MRAAFLCATFLVAVAWLPAGFDATANAQAPAAGPITDPDFAVQGEYSGDRGSMQVIARGDGEFEIVVYDRPIEGIARTGNPPRRLEGDEDTVADLVESLDLRRIERKPASLGAPPPPGAIVLFDGSHESLSNWKNGKRSDDGLLKQGTQTNQDFHDYTLHLEFRTPWMPDAKGQARGNSGVYHQGRYETQILDSFGLAGADNETGAIYEVKRPDRNACLPPLQWQAYDVDFTAARYQGDQKISDARMTVRLNGVMVQNDVSVPSATRAAKLKEGPTDGPIYLQDHGNEVRFRNIWLVPRDAAREAARPIVPGFERFFADREDPQSLGGELLISTLGCLSCHPGSRGVLPAKQGPNLSNIRERVRPDALVEMIADPHRTKPGTTMPDPWMGLNEQQRGSTAKLIASYLMLSGDPTDLVDRAAKSSGVKRGETLYHSVGCVACHRAFEGSETPTSTTVPLGHLDTKYTVDSLAKLIREPHSIRRGGRMPSLVGSVGDSYAIASYLTARVTERKNDAKFRRRIYKGVWKTLPDFDALTPVTDDLVGDLKIKEAKDMSNTAMVFDAQILITVPGNYEFEIASDDGSRLIVGPHRIDNDGIHGTKTQRATFELAAGLHPVRVQWFNLDGGISLEVRVKDPLLGKLHLREMISDGQGASGPLLASRFEPDPDAVESGKRLFRSAGCASCHEFQSATPAGGPAPNLAELRSGRGCLADSVSRPAVDFHLSPRQKRAIEGAIRLRQQQRSSATSMTDQDLVHLTMAALNCYACHRRGEFGGPEPSRDAAFETTTAEMGWEGRLPPPLDGVGDKLTDGYLEKLLAHGADERPYMRTRMPGFGADNLVPLQQSLIRLDRQPTAAAGTEESLAASPDRIPEGRKLVGASGLSCTKCHAYNQLKGGGLGMIDLLAMPKRLRASWFQRYLQDPTTYRPGTRMPNSFPDGKSAFAKLFDGDPDQQIGAMWAYLSAGTSAKEPSGLRAGAILLTPTDRPRIYRNFFEGVSGRGIAVGYPDGVNLIWDAERMGLNRIWKNEFIDAARHWVGRGQGRTAPAGDHVVALEPWTPLAHGGAIDMTWPSEFGRELGYRFEGYRLDPQGNPAFGYRIGDVAVEDSILPVDANGFDRTLTIHSGSETETASGFIWRIARAETIDRREDAFRVGAADITLTGAQGEIVSVDGQSELRALVPAGESVTVTEHIRW
jgi:cytochrome c2